MNLLYIVPVLVVFIIVSSRKNRTLLYLLCRRISRHKTHKTKKFDTVVEDDECDDEEIPPSL